MIDRGVIKPPSPPHQAASSRPGPTGRRRPRPAQGFLPVFAAMEQLPSPSSASRRIRDISRSHPAREKPASETGPGSANAISLASMTVDKAPAAETSRAKAPVAMDAEDVLKWVEDNLPQIKGHARKYLAYSPYELEEFVQQAYETALAVRKDNRLKTVSFERIFWSSFRVDCLGMTYTHGRSDVFHDEYQEFGDGESPATETPAELLIDGEEIFDSIDGQPELFDIVDDLSPEKRKMVVRRALDLMTFKERRAWEFRLAGYTRRETARLMCVSRQNVQNFLKRGLMRVKDLSSPSELRIAAASGRRRPKFVSLSPAQHYLPLIKECLV